MKLANVNDPNRNRIIEEETFINILTQTQVSQFPLNLYMVFMNLK